MVTMTMRTGLGTGLGEVRLENGQAGLGSVRLDVVMRAGLGSVRLHVMMRAGHRNVRLDVVMMTGHRTVLGTGHAVMTGSGESNGSCCHESCDEEVFHNFNVMSVFVNKAFSRLFPSLTNNLCQCKPKIRKVLFI